jgi:hypothetical protein
MDELVLPLTYNGKEIELPVKIYSYGYIHRVEVVIGGTVVIFEPDEEGSYRALVTHEQMENNKIISAGLLMIIAEALEKLR